MRHCGLSSWHGKVSGTCPDKWAKLYQAALSPQCSDRQLCLVSRGRVVAIAGKEEGEETFWERWVDGQVDGQIGGLLLYVRLAVCPFVILLLSSRLCKMSKIPLSEGGKKAKNLTRLDFLFLKWANALYGRWTHSFFFHEATGKYFLYLYLM